jgi:ATP synthase I subunit
VSAVEFLARLKRETMIAVAVLATITLVLRPTQPRIALGVLGGGVLVGLSYWGVRGVGDVVAEVGKPSENRGDLRRWALVKFFTRHAILALAAYGMMARLQLHPLGLLIGVSAPAVAAAFEVLRGKR